MAQQAYEVTATRKRPQQFDKLVGQDFVVSTLENAIKEGRIAHAYLFSGPRGVGKTSSARLLAKALNCESDSKPTAHPCGECDSCKAIAQGKSVDVIEIDGASNTSVNDIRAIKDEVMYPPQSSRYKIYIIDEVHMLSTSAFNALLKTIEEPPEYIIFIFATTELQKVPATIRSRCQQFRFHLIGQKEIIECLQEAAEDLNIAADEDALFWIARESTGSMRDAYTLFDQVAAFSGDHITLAKIREKLSIAGFGAISGIVRKALLKQQTEALSALSELFESGVSADQIIKDSAEFFRTLMLYKAGVKRTDVLGSPLDEIPNDIVSMLTEEQIEAALKAFLNLYRDIRYSLSPKFEIELMFMRLSALPLLTSTASLIEKLENMKKGIAEGSIVVKAPKEAIKLESVQEAQKPQPSSPLPEKVSSIASKEEHYETESEVFDENTEEGFTITINDLPAIAEALRKMGKSVAARYISSIDKVEEKDGAFIFTTQKPLAYNSLKNDERDLNKAVAAAFGESPIIKLKLEEKTNEDDAFSPQMKELRSFFGGNLIRTGKENNKEIEESNVPKHESIRTDEDNGLNPEPDEDD